MENNTAQKIKFSIKDLFRNEETLNGKLNFFVQRTKNTIHIFSPCEVALLTSIRMRMNLQSNQQANKLKNQHYIINQSNSNSIRW